VKALANQAHSVISKECQQLLCYCRCSAFTCCVLRFVELTAGF